LLDKSCCNLSIVSVRGISQTQLAVEFVGRPNRRRRWPGQRCMVSLTSRDARSVGRSCVYLYLCRQRARARMRVEVATDRCLPLFLVVTVRRLRPVAREKRAQTDSSSTNERSAVDCRHNCSARRRPCTARCRVGRQRCIPHRDLFESVVRPLISLSSATAAAADAVVVDSLTPEVRQVAPSRRRTSRRLRSLLHDP
jgi:hypothetical protein